jgi:hypothetical protein
MAYLRRRGGADMVMEVTDGATEGDLRFLASWERLAPNFVKKQRSGLLVWYFGMSWPVIPAAAFANYAADLPCGYSNPVSWPL